MSISVENTKELPDNTDLLRAIILKQSKQNKEISLKHAVLLTQIKDQESEFKKQIADQTLKFKQQVIDLQARLDRQLNFRFGQKSEKQNQLQMVCDDMPIFSGKAAELVEGDDEKDLVVTADPKPKRQPKRKPIDQNTDLPVIETIFEPSKKTPICKNCNIELKKFGQEETVQYDYIPSSIKLRKIIRPKYSCKKCNDSGVKIADMPAQPIPKSNAGAGLLSDLLVNKYHDHLPLYRITQIYERLGGPISRSTLSDWVMKCGALLKPITDFMLDEILKSHHIFTDDTGVPVQNGKGKLKKGTLWVYLGDEDYQYCVFKYSPDRKGMYPQEVLKNYRGYIHADAYTGYDHLFKPKLAGLPQAFECSCWVHTRRYFANIVKTGPILKEAEYAVKQIGKLYKIEDDAKDFTPEKRKQYRLVNAKPIIDKFGIWLEAHKDFDKHTDFKKAVTYACNQWASLQRYLEDGRLFMDNNYAERAIRPVAIGRKNWLFAGNDNAAKNAAVIQSLIGTCKIHKINPLAYLNDALLVMAEAKDSGRLKDGATFTPLAWKNLNKDAIEMGKS